jgi:hypothetical protein
MKKCTQTKLFRDNQKENNFFMKNYDIKKEIDNKLATSFRINPKILEYWRENVHEIN